MKALLPIAMYLAASASPALAQGGGFNLTYHVERTPAAKLSLTTCGNTVAQVARRSGLTVGAQNSPGKLVSVSGGKAGLGAFVAQCIAVNNTTVIVIHGIDYHDQKGSLGRFADSAFAAVKAVIR